MNKFFFPYIIIELKGGIGNLLFQYSAALKFSKIYNARIVFYEYESNTINYLENYLKIKLNSVSNLELFLVANGNRSKGYKKKPFPYFLKLMNILKLYLGDHHHGGFGQSFTLLNKKNFFNFFKILYLDGYYQHPDYYEKVLPEVLSLLSSSLTSKNKSNLDNQTVIHLRRSDYLKNKWELSKDYYLKSLKIIDPDKIYPVVILSDDPLAIDAFYYICKNDGYEVKELKSNSKNKTFTSDDKRDFQIIMNSRNVIMSNSSFAWWSVVLGDHVFGTNERKIIYPKGWIKGFPDVLKRESWITSGNIETTISNETGYKVNQIIGNNILNEIEC